MPEARNIAVGCAEELAPGSSARLLSTGLTPRQAASIVAAQACLAWLRPMTGWEAAMRYSEMSRALSNRDFPTLYCELANVHHFANNRCRICGSAQVVQAIEDFAKGMPRGRFSCFECQSPGPRDRIRRHLCTSCAEHAVWEEQS